MLFLFLIAILATLAQADLTCLTWGLISSHAGTFCHFKSEIINAVETATVNEIKSLVDQVKGLLDFDVTHNPGVVAYDYVKTTATQGSSSANSRLGQSLGDVANVTLGFNKGVANMAYTLFEVTFWGDVSHCLITSALQSAPNSGETISTTRKRASAMSPEAGLKIVGECLSDKVKKISNAKVFNITDPNQDIGNTIAQVASFFVPIGTEEKAAEAGSHFEIQMQSLDLVIPGSEDAGRIFKQVGTNGEATHFASEEEALGVKQNLEDPAWTDANCVLAVPPARVGAQSRVRRRDRKLQRRGNGMSVACKPPQPAAAAEAGYEILPDFEGHATAIDRKASRQDQFVLHDPRYYTDNIPESIIETTPDIKPYAHVLAKKKDIVEDLQDFDFTSLAWSPDVTDALSSDAGQPPVDIFKMLRGVFNPSTADEQAASAFLGVGGSDQKSFWDSTWSAANTDNMQGGEIIKRLQALTKGIETQCKDIVQVLKGWTNSEPDFQKLIIRVDYYYTPPSQRALQNSKRGFRTHGGIMQMTTSDVPGLVVKWGGRGPNDVVLSYTRPNVLEQGWHLLKGLSWTGSTKADGATRYSVFGPEMAERGRVTITATASIPLPPPSIRRVIGSA